MEESTDATASERCLHTVQVACPAQLLDVCSVNTVLVCSPQAPAPGQHTVGETSTAKGDKSLHSQVYFAQLQLTPEHTVNTYAASPSQTDFASNGTNTRYPATTCWLGRAYS